jgi:O-antigen/teichoic acid export membrane protein
MRSDGRPGMWHDTTSSHEQKTMNSIRARLKGGVSWNFAASICTQGATFLTTIVLTHMAGLGIFGRYSMVQSTLMTVVTLSTLAMSTTTTKFISEFRSTDKDRTGRLLNLFKRISMGAGAVSAVLLLATADLIAHVLKDPSLAPGVRIGSIFLFFSTVNFYQLGGLAGLEGYRSLAIAAALSGTVTLAAASAGMYLFGFVGAIAGQAVGSLCRYIFYRMALAMECSRNDIVPHSGPVPERAQFLSKFALPAMLSAYSSIPAAWFANGLVFRHSGGSSQMALYTAALTFKTVLLFLPMTITGVTLPVINHARATTDLGRYLRLYGLNVLAVSAASIVFAVPFLLFGETLLKAFGRDYSAGREILTIMVVSAAVDGIGIAISPIFQAQGRMWLLFCCLTLPRDAMFVTIVWRWVPLTGAIGLARATLISGSYLTVASAVLAYAIIRGLRNPVPRLMAEAVSS